jgi:hypothetical protein
MHGTHLGTQYVGVGKWTPEFLLEVLRNGHLPTVVIEHYFVGCHSAEPTDNPLMVGPFDDDLHALDEAFELHTDVVRKPLLRGEVVGVALPDDLQAQSDQWSLPVHEPSRDVDVDEHLLGARAERLKEATP